MPDPDPLKSPAYDVHVRTASGECVWLATVESLSRAAKLREQLAAEYPNEYLISERHDTAFIDDESISE